MAPYRRRRQQQQRELRRCIAEAISREVVSMSDGLEANSLLLRIILSNEDEDTNTTNTEEYDPLKSKAGVNINSLRHTSLTTAVQSLSTYDVLYELQILDEFRRSHKNLYQRVRALFFLYAIHRFHLPERRGLIEKEIKKKKNADLPQSIESENECTGGCGNSKKTVFCPKGYDALLDRRFDESIDYFLASVPTSSSIPISPDDDFDNISDSTSKLNIAPRRTSLLSNLTFSRMESSATVSSMDGDDDYTYSCNSVISSFLEGERLLSSVNNNSSSSIIEENDSDKPTLLLPSNATSSALAKAYRELAFQTLADQVKSSVRSHPGNEWMFQLDNVAEQPLRWSKEMLSSTEGGNGKQACPTLLERTPVRMDLSHSCWSDIFFLGMVRISIITCIWT